MAYNSFEPEPEPAEPEPAEDNRPIIYLPRLQLTKAVFDTSMFIAFLNDDQRIRQHIGNPKIHHTEITKNEWSGHFSYLENLRREAKDLPPKEPNSKLAQGRTARALAVFDSIYLPETPQVKAITTEILGCLLEAGFVELEGRTPTKVDMSDARAVAAGLTRAGVRDAEIEAYGLTVNDMRDIGTAAYAMAYGMDVVAADRLFYTIGAMFQSDSTMYVNRKRNSSKQALRMVGRLEAKGDETPAELAHLIRLNTSDNIRQAKTKGGEADDRHTDDRHNQQHN